MMTAAKVRKAHGFERTAGPSVMRPLLTLPLTLLILTSTLLVPTSAAQRLTYEGRVVATGLPVEVLLDAPQDVPRGTVAYSFASKEVGEREVGVLTGAFRVLRAEEQRLYLVPVEPGSASVGVKEGTSVRVEDRVQIAFSGPPGFVSLSSEPTGARVVWRGEELGETPLVELRLAPGPYTFTFVAPGYRPFTLPVDAPAGHLVEISPATLIPFPEARSYFEETNRLYYAHNFDEARAALDSVGMFQDDGSITDSIRRDLPLLRDLVTESLGLVERNAEVSADTVAQAALAYRLYRRNVNGVNPRAVLEGVGRLNALLPSDSLARRLYAEHRLPLESTRGRR